MSVKVNEAKCRYNSDTPVTPQMLGFHDQEHHDAFVMAVDGIRREDKKSEIKKKLDRWDLRMIRDRALKDGHYTEHDIARIEKLYKGYMYKAMTTEGSLRVDPEIDDFWHTHLLFTRNYAEMCTSISGKFVHHDPFDYGDGRCKRDCHHCKGGK